MQQLPDQHHPPRATFRHRFRLHPWLLAALGLALGLNGCVMSPPQTVATIVPAATASATPLVVAASSPSVAPATHTARPTPSASPTPTQTTIAPTATTDVPPPDLDALSPPPTPMLLVLDEARRAAVFDKVWDTIATHYLYADFGGVDWGEIRLKYESRAVNAATSDEFYDALRAMVAELRDQHSRFEDPQEAFEEQALATGAAYVGIGVLTVADDDGLLVTTVFPGSPAENAGIKRRDMIVAVGGQPVDPLDPGISGEAETDVQLDVRASDGTMRRVLLKRQVVLAKYVPDVYLLPGTQIGYVLIQSFWAQDMAQTTSAALQKLLADHGPLDGLIVDVRANGGGWRSVLEGLLADFVAGEVGSFYDQRANYPLTVAPGPMYESLKDVPIVVLVDRDTKSYAEVFAAVLQAERQAQVIGVNSAGNTETIYAHDIDDGSRLWVAQEGFKLRNGANLEGRGVIPDRSIPIDWTRYSERQDPHIVRAVQFIRQQVAGSD